MRKHFILFLSSALLLSACGTGITQDDVDAAVSEALSAQEEGHAAEIAELTDDLEAARDDLQGARDSGDESAEEVAALEEQVAELSAERDQLVAERDQLIADQSTDSESEGGEEPPTDPVEIPPSELVVVSDGLSLAQAPEGAVGVVASQALGDDRIALTIHNNTGSTVSFVEVSATIRDADGALVGSDSTDDFQPIFLEADEFAVGQLYFGLDLDETPSDGSVEFVVDYEEGSPSSLRFRLPVIEWTQSSSGFAGVVGNPTGVTQTLVEVAVGCFSESGEMLGYADSFADRDSIPAEESAPFSLRHSRIDECPQFMLVSSGWED